MERLSTTPAPRLTTAETIAVALTMMLAIAALAGYVIDAAGFGVQPLAAAAAAVLAAGVVAWRLPCDHTVRRSDVFAWFGIVVFVGAMLLRLSWPHLVPPGRGSDLTHHLLLVDYIEQHGHLVHDRSLSGAMGEMAHYTPGSHLLAVMAGRWFGADGLRAFYPLIVLCAALAAGFVFLIARRILLPMPFAIAAVVLLCLPAPYFFGAFTQDAFLAQSVSTLFAVAMWWALVAWHDLRATAVAWVMALCLAATFLSWPVFVGPPLIVFLAMLSGANLPAPARWRHLAIVVVPWLALVLLHSWDRWGWMTIVSASGAVLRPSLDSVGWLVPILAATGAILAMSDIRARITGILLVVIGLQSLTLFILAAANDADTPYMALKMMYLAIYPMAVLGAFAVTRLTGESRVTEPLGWLVAAALVIAARPVFNAPRPIPVVDADLYAAGKLVRAQGAAACVDYLVTDSQTAYWLHLAVLGNPRSSDRTREIDVYDPNAAIAPWITAAGRNYAIADLRLLPDEVRSQVDIAAQIGHAAVITRRGVTMKGCD